MNVETALLVSAHWPSAVCSERGLHGWQPGPFQLTCAWCGDYLAWSECRAYQNWTIYWNGLALDTNRLN